MSAKKPKATLGKKIRLLFTFHPWLKLISLLLAIMIWFYAKQEMKIF